MAAGLIAPIRWAFELISQVSIDLPQASAEPVSASVQLGFIATVPPGQGSRRDRTASAGVQLP